MWACPVIGPLFDCLPVHNSVCLSVCLSGWLASCLAGCKCRTRSCALAVVIYCFSPCEKAALNVQCIVKSLPDLMLRLWENSNSPLYTTTCTCLYWAVMYVRACTEQLCTYVPVLTVQPHQQVQVHLPHSSVYLLVQVSTALELLWTPALEPLLACYMYFSIILTYNCILYLWIVNYIIIRGMHRSFPIPPSAV